MTSAPSVLAVKDFLFTDELVELALASSIERGYGVHRGWWRHETIESFRVDVSAFERAGADAVVNKPDWAAMPGLAEARFLVVQFCPVGKDLFEAAPNLEAIGVIRVGFENVDLEAARQAGVRVLNAPGRNVRAVAEFTVGMLLAEIRNIARSHRRMMAGDWVVRYPNMEHESELQGKTVGIVGAGQIGRITAGLVAAFGCRVLMNDPFVESFPDGVEAVELDRLLAESDFVVLHARLTGQSRHLIGARELALMKPSATLVNTARAGLVDETALAQALEDRTIAGAALDVYSAEPLAADHPLAGSPHATFTPHIAAVTVEAYRRGPLMMSDCIRDHFAGNCDNLPYVL